MRSLSLRGIRRSRGNGTAPPRSARRMALVLWLAFVGLAMPALSWAGDWGEKWGTMLWGYQEPVATFNVSKDYSDSSDEPVEVMLSCNNGLPLEQTFNIAPGSPVTFTLTEFTPGSVTCEVTEIDGPANYVPSYDNGSTVSATGCVFDAIYGAGSYGCAITNSAGNAFFTVTKHWVLANAGFEEAGYDVQVDVVCSADIVSVDGQPIIDPDGRVTVFLGDGESSALEVDTSGGSASCSAAELVTASDVESVSEGCMDVALAAGDSAQCAFTNTLFFEGVPALDRYGLALLTLLMLGVGALGMRRFV